MDSLQQNISLNDISIRNQLCPGDIGYISYLHGRLYHEEYNHGIAFEAYVAKGLAEFYQNYSPDKDNIWICEHSGSIVGSLFLLQREQAAQLRYFLICPEYRGLGLGKKLMEKFMDYMRRHNFTSSYLWTTNELEAAASLYKRHGFEPIEEKPSTNFGKSLTKQKYELILNPGA